MSTSFSPNQQQSIADIQEKWEKTALSTDPIDSAQAIASVQRAYQINGFKEPTIYICSSPLTGFRKLMELHEELGDLGEGGNQDIQLHSEWFFTYQGHLDELSGRISSSLSYVESLFAPLEKHLEQTILYKPTSQQVDCFRPNLRLNLDESLEQLGHYLQEGCAIPRGYFYNKITIGSLALEYCRWDIRFSILNWEHDADKWESSKVLLETCGYIMPFEEICIICDRPSKILMDDRQRLHAVGESALSFRDGYEIFAQHGELLPGGKIRLTLQDYLNLQEYQLRQSIIEQTLEVDLPIDWLFQEKNSALRQILLEKIDQSRVNQSLTLQKFGLSTLPIESHSSLPWIIYAIAQQSENLHIKEILTSVQSLSNISDIDRIGSLTQRLLLNGIDRIAAWLETNAPDQVAKFLPGLSLQEIDERISSLPCKLSQEIYDLYQTHDGTEGESELFVYHSFMPLDTAIEYFEYLNEKESIQFRYLDGDPTYLFPVFDFQGEYFAIAGGETITETSPVYHVSDCCECSIAFNSLSTMMLTLAECYESGVYVASCEEEGNSDSKTNISWENHLLFEEIRRKYNPGTTHELYGYS